MKKYTSRDSFVPVTVCIDRGNTRVKCGIFEDNLLQKVQVFTLPRQKSSLQKLLNRHLGDYMILSDVVGTGKASSGLAFIHKDNEKHMSLKQLVLPVTIGYRTPATLGADRLALACGARVLYPKNPVLVISAGTCITYEFITRRGQYMGGAIAPGLHMRLQAMHAYTAKLPLIKELPVQIELIGRSTQDAMLSGAIIGAASEIEHTISLYTNKYKGLVVIITGGDGAYLHARLKSKIFALPHLALTGLNNILQLNAEKTFSP